MPERLEHAGGAAPTTLVGTVTASATVLSIADATNWPTGATGPFYVTLDRGVSAEERVKIVTRSGTTLTVATGGRGADGTAATSHVTGSAVEHTFSATEADEANAHLMATTGVHGLASGVAPVGLTATQTLTNKTISGASNTLNNIAKSSVTDLVADLAAVNTKADLYSTVADDGTARTQRNTLNFGDGVTAVDNAGATRTDVSLSYGTSGTALTVARSDHEHVGTLKGSAINGATVSSSTSESAATASSTVAVVAGRRYKVEFGGDLHAVGGQCGGDVRIYTDAAVLSTVKGWLTGDASAQDESRFRSVTWTPAASATVTLALKITRTSASNTIQLVNGYWYVYDVGLV